MSLVGFVPRQRLAFGATVRSPGSIPFRDGFVLDRLVANDDKLGIIANPTMRRNTRGEIDSHAHAVRPTPWINDIFTEQERCIGVGQGDRPPIRGAGEGSGQSLPRGSDPRDPYAVAGDDPNDPSLRGTILGRRVDGPGLPRPLARIWAVLPNVANRRAAAP